MTDRTRSPADLAATAKRGMLVTTKLDGTPTPCAAALDELRQRADDAAKWLTWSDGRYPDDSPGDVIHADTDGTITLDDGITTWNPLRALALFAARVEMLSHRADWVHPDDHAAVAADTERLREALTAIRDLPGEYDLLMNAMAKAMWTYADRALVSPPADTEQP